MSRETAPRRYEYSLTAAAVLLAVTAVAEPAAFLAAGALGFAAASLLVLEALRNRQHAGSSGPLPRLAGVPDASARL